jgi:hypothetical protein
MGKSPINGSFPVTLFGAQAAQIPTPRITIMKPDHAAGLDGVTKRDWKKERADAAKHARIYAAPILPALDLGTAYLLNNTASGLPVVNQDNGFSFVNARSYESVTFIFDNNGTHCAISPTTA